VRFKATPIVGSTKVTIGLVGFPGAIAYEAHGNLGRELVRLANLQLEREEAENDDEQTFRLVPGDHLA